MPRTLRLIVALLAPLILLLAAGSPAAHPLPRAPSCPMFPPDSPWNQRVDRLPVARNSATYIRSIGLADPVHPAFGAGNWDGRPIGIPINVGRPGTRGVRLHFPGSYEKRSDRVAYPLSDRTAIEDGVNGPGDHHVIVVDPARCLDYELWEAHRFADGRWSAVSGVRWNLLSDRLRPPGSLSADAAGLPILPALARYDEVARGSIDHALRFTARYTRAAFVYPARHFGDGSHDPALPPMGIRVRLRAGVNTSHLPYQARVIATALKRYGMILADNGPSWYISGTPDARWNNAGLHLLNRLHGWDFQVVNTASLPHPGR